MAIRIAARPQGLSALAKADWEAKVKAMCPNNIKAVLALVSGPHGCIKVADIYGLTLKKLEWQAPAKKGDQPKAKMRDMLMQEAYHFVKAMLQMHGYHINERRNGEEITGLYYAAEIKQAA